jgi:AraC-like DNA-binding protein
MDLISIIILLGIAQGIFFGSLLIIMRSPNRRANRFLGALFIAFSISISHFLFLRLHAYAVWPFLMGMSFPVLFLFGPLEYFYVKILTDRTTTLGKRALLHLIPFVLAFAVNLPFFLMSNADKLVYVENMQNPRLVHMGLFVGVVQVIHLFLYVQAALRILNQYDHRIRETKSSIEKISLAWVRAGAFGLLAVFSYILLLIVLQMSGVHAIAFYSLSVPIIVSLVIYVLAYLGLRQPEIFSPADETVRKYERSSLTPERVEEHAARLSEHMSSNRPHLESELTLPMLADQVGIPPHHLSQVINTRFGSNFFDFINNYRVEEAKRLFLDKSKAPYTILAIAQEAGFNSKTAFNTAFKRATGQTPSVYRSTVENS